MSHLPADFLAELRAALGDAVHDDPLSLQAHAGDNSWRQQLPALVVSPRSIEQVQATLRCCHRHGVPVVARGAGTGTTGSPVSSVISPCRSAGTRVPAKYCVQARYRSV